MKRRHNLWANTEPISMRVPFSLLFLGWWVSQQRWMVTGQYYYSKPSVSVSPEVVTLGGSVSVHCSNANHPHAEFFLYKGNSDSRPLFSKVATGYGVVFIISITKISDAGIYRCLYCFISGPNEACSYYSDEVHIHVTGQYFPKPSVSVSPEVVTLGGSVSVRCSNAIYPYAEFFLYKGKSYSYALSSKVATDYGVEFIISITSISDAGIYQCLYCFYSAPNKACSYYSDEVHIHVTDSSLRKPSINVKPEGPHDIGMNVTIECKGPEDRLTFSLHKSNNLTALQIKEPQGDTATFSLPAVRLEDAGNYTCRYSHRGNCFLYSESSASVEVTVSDKKLGMHKKPFMTIIWASIAAGLLVLFLLVLIFVLCKKRKNGSTIKERNQAVNMILEQDAGIDHEDGADRDGITYAVLNIQQPANQHRGPESCVYASVAKGQNQRSPI